MKTAVTTKPVKKAAAKQAARRVRPRKMTDAEEAALWASLDEQTKDIVKRIQRLKRVL